MEKIKSLVDITVNLNMTTTITDRVIGEIIKVEFSGDFNQLVVSYIYRAEGGQLIKSDKLILKEEEIDGLNEMVKNFLPSDFNDMTEREQLKQKYLIGFKLKMSETFNIQISNIEIFDDSIEELQSPPLD